MVYLSLEEYYSTLLHVIWEHIYDPSNIIVDIIIDTMSCIQYVHDSVDESLFHGLPILEGRLLYPTSCYLGKCQYSIQYTLSLTLLLIQYLVFKVSMIQLMRFYQLFTNINVFNMMVIDHYHNTYVSISIAKNLSAE